MDLGPSVFLTAPLIGFRSTCKKVPTSSHCRAGPRMEWKNVCKVHGSLSGSVYSIHVCSCDHCLGARAQNHSGSTSYHHMHWQVPALTSFLHCPTCIVLILSCSPISTSPKNCPKALCKVSKFQRT